MKTRIKKKGLATYTRCERSLFALFTCHHLDPKMLANKTTYVASVSSKASAAAAHLGRASKSATSLSSGFRASVSPLTGVSLKTSYVAPVAAFASQKRHYASKAPLSVLENGADSTVPPANKYLKDSAKYSDAGSRNLAYGLIGAFGVVQAVAVKNIAVDLVSSLAASADVLALAKIEVNQADIPEGKNVVLKWRGKPVFIRHRTAADIAEANSVDIASLRHKEADVERVKEPEWLVMMGVCTHLGCVPIGDAGDYNGWFCPCHGSHYDISGRIRKGPAPLNLEIPPYELIDGRIVIG
ncbi:Rieske [2Fe-2S] iron-sulfur domain-containing protein [Chytriomyces sp. MP71]|nr:Rieske [2Fe-2S] iron-sulfur domain-containing protein [Chytriomyces sp. MP71]